MNISGKKMGSVKALKDSLKKGGSSNNNYIKNVSADGITVRFLTEPEEWFGYYEYWNDESRNFCPMAVGEVLPDGAKPSFRYLACVVEVETDRVIPIKLAKTAANSLILKYDKFGTMTDRNYELQRHGEGLDTTYDVTPDSPSKMNLAKYDLLNLEKILIDARAHALGESDTEERASKKPTVDDDEVDSDSEYDYASFFNGDEYRYDYTEDELQYLADNHPDDFGMIVEEWEIEDAGSIKANIRAVLKAQKDYDADSDADEADDDTGADYYDEDALKAMSLRDLVLIAEDLEIEGKGLGKDELISAIIEATEE